jgi:hypothetical protein
MMEKAIITSGSIRDERNKVIARFTDSDKAIRATAEQLAEAARPLTKEEQLYYDLLASGMSTRQAKRKMLKMAKKKK